MPFIEWSDDYKCNIASIDDDHRMLFHIVNSLHDDVSRDAPTREIGATIAALINYVEIHFTREERYLDRYSYPEANAHKQAHAALKNKVLGIQEIFQKNPKQLDIGKVLEFLKNWLTTHIQQEDFKYIPFLKGDLAGIHTSVDDAAQEVSVSVPTLKVPLIHACAEILTAGGTASKQLENALRTIGGQTTATGAALRDEFLKQK